MARFESTAERGVSHAPLLIGLALTAIVTGCTDEGRDRGMEAGLQVDQAAITFNVCADGPTTFGIDVSKWQGTIDWPQVAAAGVKFAVIRISDGLDFVDQRFEENWAGAEANGILRSAYQFFRSDEDPIAQAELVLDKLDANGMGELPAVIDVESTDGQSPATIAAKVGQWLDHVQATTHRKAIIYTGSYFWRDNVATTAHDDHPLWIAHWGVDCPSLPDPWSRWDFHQYSATGSVAGISGDVDLNRFNGTLAELQAFGGAQQCLTDPGYSTCDGSLLLRCDAGGQLSSDDCAASDGQCSTSGGDAHCVHLYCWSVLGGENGTFCRDGETLGSCSGGNYSDVSACGAGGCSEAGGSAHCVDPGCAGNETASRCVDGGTVGVCEGGSFSQFSCGPEEVCAPLRPSEAACVDRVCWVDRGGADGAFCLDEATTASCIGGALMTAPCPSGQRCTQSGDVADCRADGAPEADAGPTTDADGPSDAVAGDPSVRVSGISRQTSLRTRRADQGCRGGGSGSPGVPATLLVLVLVLLRRLGARGAARPR